MAVINTKHPLVFKLQMTEHHTKDQTGAYNINLQENAPFILQHTHFYTNTNKTSERISNLLSTIPDECAEFPHERKFVLVLK